MIACEKTNVKQFLGNLCEKDSQKAPSLRIAHIFRESRETKKNDFREGKQMIERKVILKNQTGLHARPASELVAFAKELPCKVYLEHNGKKAA